MGEFLYEPSNWQQRYHALTHHEALGAGAAGPGKALWVETPIPTARGLVRMGDLKVGDKVFDDSGSLCTVVFATGEMLDHVCYEVFFDDGSSIVADAEHLWFTHDYGERVSRLRAEKRSHRRTGLNDQRSKAKKPRLRTTDELRETLVHLGRKNHTVDVAGALMMPPAELPVDPYLLGVWLGDGGSGGARIYSVDEEVVESFALAGFKVSKGADPIGWNIGGGFRSALRAAGVLPKGRLRKGGSKKHVPESYQQASVEQRLALLQGLVDTDGHVDRDGRVELTLCNERLAHGAFRLVCSLGFKATMRASDAILSGRSVGTRYRICWSPRGVQVCRLRRKMERLGSGERTQRWRYVTKVSRVPSVPVRCIQVDSASRLYLAGVQCIPTHNTTCLTMEPLQQIRIEHARCARNPRLITSDENDPLFQMIEENPLQWGESRGWSLYLRRDRTRMTQIITRMALVIPKIDPGAKWNSEYNYWTLSSGFKYQFDHCFKKDDWQRFDSNEYCMAKGQRVVMADGALRAIEDVVVGDMVQTLEGPRRVSATYATGRKPCVEAVVRVRGEIVGTQVFPTTHPVLALTTSESTPSQSPGSPQNGLRCRPRGMIWTDYESLLCGLEESQVKRASRVDGESGFVTSGGLRLELRQLQPLTFPVVLHEQTALKALARARSSMGSGAHQGARGSSAGQPQASWPHLSASPADPMQTLSDELPCPRRIVASCACGGACGRPGRGTATGLTGRCLCHRDLRGEPPRHCGAYGREPPRPPVGAAGHTRTSSLKGGLGQAPSGTWCLERGPAPSYPHFYSGEARPLTEDVRTGFASLKFAGWFETFDLTVEGANHYISETGLVESQTLILFDELIQFLQDQYEQIKVRARIDDPVLMHFVKVRSMSNPHSGAEAGMNYEVENPGWVKEYFVDPAPEGNVTMTREMEMSDGTKEVWERIYLPAKLTDNPNKEFVKKYELSLRAAPPHIRRAKLEGDWESSEGAFFAECWNRQMHVVEPFGIPSDWGIFRSCDWGFVTPGCVHWWAVDPDDMLWVVAEFTFKNRHAERVGRDVIEIEKKIGILDGHKSLITGPADTQLWEERGETAVRKVDEFRNVGVVWAQANKKSRRRNAELVARRLQGVNAEGGDGPGVRIFSTCRMLCRTLPLLGTDKNDISVPRKGGDDHWYDSFSYGVGYAEGRKIPSIDQRRRTRERQSVRQDGRPKNDRSGYGSPM